ncbi:MAG: DsbE family thiol:disulfide interchange protein [Gammaproteobacteria bacterium]|nr:DsbE family thiol:disulfide interchange protein [Gammaproteobacteria bacterium]MBT4492710.1 DsbE family thiol:disulfide interchange protein [Gammaproteobacteria bacterium]MBT7371890.1 DsbE family thiol:disulfide interchange protein [Gammaproteobacteria bacterium]
MKKSFLIPLGIFLLLVLFLGLGFQLKDPHYLPSVMINKPFPEFELKDLHQPEKIRKKEDLIGEVALVNVWATWCPNCVIEHPELLRISKDESITLFGINYNDETVKAINWLARREDPYRFSIVDDEGKLAIDLGVYGAPETFVIDSLGVIRFRYVGPVTNEVWQQEILPIVEHLRSSQ